jgi:hypothetical protein
MPKHFMVSINWKALQTHLAKEHGHALSTEDIHAWLRDAGFVQTGDRWLVKEKDLGALDPSEVLEADEVDPNSSQKD